MQDAAADLFKAPAALMAFGGLFFVVVAVRLQPGTKMLTDKGLLSGSREEICIPALKKVIKKSSEQLQSSLCLWNTGGVSSQNSNKRKQRFNSGRMQVKAASF